MKLTNRMTLTASLLLISGAAFGQAGHEALGDCVHIEYFLAASAAVAASLYALIRNRRNGQD